MAASVSAAASRKTGARRASALAILPATADACEAVRPKDTAATSFSFKIGLRRVTRRTTAGRSEHKNNGEVGCV